MWLGVGAITVGVCAALASGTGLAHADTAHPGADGNTSNSDAGPKARAPKVRGIAHRPVGLTPSAPANETAQLSVPRSTNIVVRGAVTTGPAGIPRRLMIANATLGWVYRELRYTLFNRPPSIIAVQHSQDPLSGVVTGQLRDSTRHAGRPVYTVSQPGNALVQVNPGGSFTVTPDSEVAHHGGTVSFTVTADNGLGYRLSGPMGRLQSVIHSFAVNLGLSGPDTTSTLVVVDVAATNQPPVVNGYTASTSAGTGTVAGQMRAADSNNDNLDFSGPTTSALGGSVTVNPDGSFTYVPTAEIRHAAAAVNASDAVKADSFTVTVSDGYGGTASTRVDVAVSPANGNPTGGTVADLQVDDIIGFVTGSISGVADPDADSLSYTVNPTSAGGGYVDVFSDGSFTYNPTAEQRHLAAALGAPFATTHDSFAVFVADGHGGGTAIIVIVPIAPEADEPPSGEEV
ncbi:Ig-like domain-containing protein [Mycolicibacterium vinylchloridicum]|uniref:Ig-like domain-containing protein n=1 Tax=Mycolicibacterium vinylchloridicum TaxID=2736928 RepID=UPI0015C9A852|nr:Ig-like domain-containing protein [Mycolicibacterium vinylchloridicum]